jgi:hypothetical protein
LVKRRPRKNREQIRVYRFRICGGDLMVEEPTLPPEDPVLGAIIPKTPTMGKIHMSEQRLATLLHSRYPNILPAVLDIYEEVYGGVPWERDPIRGGYRLMDRDLQFMDGVSKLITTTIPLAPLTINEGIDLPPIPTDKEFAEDLQKIIQPPVEESLPPIPHEAKVKQGVPIGPPRHEVTGAKADFSTLEAKIGAGQVPVNQAPRASKVAGSISPLEDSLRLGTTEIDIPVGTPNKSAAMASLEQKRQEIANARKRQVSQ